MTVYVEENCTQSFNETAEGVVVGLRVGEQVLGAATTGQCPCHRTDDPIDEQ